MSRAERIYWMMLVHSESIAGGLRQEDVSAWLGANAKIRRILRDKFGAGLDKLDDVAREEYREIVEGIEVERREERSRERKVDEVLKRFVK